MLSMNRTALGVSMGVRALSVPSINLASTVVSYIEIHSIQ